MNMPPILRPGQRDALGSHTFTREEIIRFASRYDPQRFHIDEEAARKSVLGGLCASGWHTAAIWMRKFRDASDAAVAAWVAAGNRPYEIGPSPGFDNLRWIRPVYVDDTISYFCTTMTCRPSASRPGWYVFTGAQEALNQKGEPVMSFDSTGFARYPAD